MTMLTPSPEPCGGYDAGMGAELTPEYVAALRRMTGAQKIKAAFELYRTARRLKAAALREIVLNARE